ncbi:MAG: tRNA (adenosine(37)-N6)-dimethylallyltransferase MiaA [Synechococcaceae cyanobacterium RL_1_2]|nr:tRNA (adenosine(37)-N6)-dimethylallyltransferase MiaA [Synechococcaceae cyanobacterium RL_1_2]
MLIVILGPTATGKTDLAIALAQKLNTEIISADSRQIYQKFNIGTAKPSPEELAIVPHHLMGSHDPQVQISLGDYQNLAQPLISQLQQQHRIPILVGGTGLYIKSIVKGLRMPHVQAQPNLREQLTRLGQSYCYQLLVHLDPPAAKKINPQDRVRTIRALEVYYVTGQPISDQQGEQPPPYPILSIGLDLDRAHHRQLIGQRVTRMIDLGLIEEVQGLISQYGPELPLLNTLGYGEIKDYLAGITDLATAQALITIHTAQFAKRQRTWFNKQPDITWLDATHPQLHGQTWELVCSFRDHLELP